MTVMDALDGHALEGYSEENRCIASRVRQLDRVLTRTYDNALRPLGITNAQLALLRAINTSGTTSVRIESTLSIEKSTLSRNLRILARRDFITVGEGGGRKAKELLLTDFGAETLKHALPLWREANAAVAAALGRHNTSQLEVIIDILV